MIIPDIIPITYMGGTGGNILTQFLIKAKNLDFSDILLSEHGNAHRNRQEVDISTFCKMGVIWSDMDKITNIMNATRFGNTFAPYFIPVHLVNTAIFKNYFNKIIRITYTEDDILDLAYIYFMKYHIDIYGSDEMLPILIGDDDRDIKATYSYKLFLPYFKHFPSDENILYVAWEEIYKDDIDKLINRLSEFTNIPKINFNKNMISNWRQITTASLTEIKDRIQHGL
jgi:hypothetical protein